MITLDSLAGTALDLDGYRAGTSASTVLTGVRPRPAAPEYQWIGRRNGAIPIPDLDTPNIEIEVPLRLKASTQDLLLQAQGKLRDKADKAAFLANQGGMESTIKIPGATYASRVFVVAIVLDDDQLVTVDQVRRKRTDITIKLICFPWYLGPEKLHASGRKPQGMPIADIQLDGAGGDLGALARLEVTNLGANRQGFFLAGLQSRNDVAGNKMLQPASTLDVSTAPLNGSYTAPVSEVQTLTKSGTISGGTWPLGFAGTSISSGFAHNASPATVQAAVDAALGAGKITVGGSALSSGNMTFTFIGDYAGRDVELLTFSGASLTGGGTVTLSQTTAAVAGYVSANAYSDWSDFTASADQTDVGTYQIWAIVEDLGSTANAVRIRAAWSVGDKDQMRINRSVAVPAVGAPVPVYLGDVHVTPRGAASHRWNVRFAVKTVGDEGTQLKLRDWIKVPTQNGRICVKTPVDARKTLVLADNFDQSAGNYGGKSMPLGGTVSSSGATGDGTVGTGALVRTNNADTWVGFVSGVGVMHARHMYAGSNLTDCAAAAKISSVRGSNSADGRHGLLLRYVDDSNYIFAGIQFYGGLGVHGPLILERVGGSYAVLARWWPNIKGYLPESGLTLASRLVTASVQSDGRINVDVGGFKLSAVSANAATGGSLASGKLGLSDGFNGSLARTTTYDNFRGYAFPPVDAAMHPSRKLTWGSDGAVEREASGGTHFGPAAGAMRAGVPIIGAAGADAVKNRLVIGSRDLNPDLGANSNPPPALDWSVYVSEAFQLGRWA